MRYDFDSARYRWRRRLRFAGIERLQYRRVQARLEPRTEAHRRPRVDLHAPIDRLADKKIVFAATPGRSGSEYVRSCTSAA